MSIAEASRRPSRNTASPNRTTRRDELNSMNSPEGPISAASIRIELLPMSMAAYRGMRMGAPDRERQKTGNSPANVIIEKVHVPLPHPEDQRSLDCRRRNRRLREIYPAVFALTVAAAARLCGGI